MYAHATVGNSTRCGHCDMPIIDGQPYWALDDPYVCLVHENCMRHFHFNGKPRQAGGAEIARLKEEMSTDEEVVAKYMQSAFFRSKRIPNLIRDAWLRVFQRALLLRLHYSPDALKKHALNVARTPGVNANADDGPVVPLQQARKASSSSLAAGGADDEPLRESDTSSKAPKAQSPKAQQTGSPKD